MNQYDKAIIINCDKECEDVIIKPFKIYRIQAAPFILLIKKQNHKIFTVIIKDIKKILKLK